MNNRKLEITDKTLVVLDSIYGEKIRKKIPQLRELVKLIYAIGSDYIEITEELYEELGPFSEDIKFKLSNNLIEIMGKHDVFENISKESLDINNNENIRFVGLDDLIFYDYEEIFSDIKKSFGCDIDMCIKNEYGSSIAMSLEWIRAGGKKIVTTFTGIGGYAPLESILGSIGFLERLEIRGDYVLFPEVLQLFEEITESEIKSNMPFIGKDIFNVESGIHVNGIVKNPSTYEPYDPSKIGRKRKIIIGKHSGISALKIKLKELDIEYKYCNLVSMLEEVRNISTEKRRGLMDQEIKEIYMKCSNLY
ncbi:isopropylmalate synthase [Clostridium chromiireducens]|uniref:Isopropylmalate synthase n=1 Tax=Clostridium chromiireducens TaxID=225345 RepID=A0A399IPX8_9CLOT|nr:isopropylmalate synthase [Clostridium chromiireducens]RII34369.1 isopropylmalate synthase [Clostridium chromiireducens]